MQLRCNLYICFLRKQNKVFFCNVEITFKHNDMSVTPKVEVVSGDFSVTHLFTQKLFTIEFLYQVYQVSENRSNPYLS